MNYKAPPAYIHTYPIFCLDLRNPSYVVFSCTQHEQVGRSSVGCGVFQSPCPHCFESSARCCRHSALHFSPKVAIGFICLSQRDHSGNEYLNSCVTPTLQFLLNRVQGHYFNPSVYKLDLHCELIEKVFRLRLPETAPSLLSMRYRNNPRPCPKEVVDHSEGVIAAVWRAKCLRARGCRNTTRPNAARPFFVAQPELFPLRRRREIDDQST